tara:strand:+ start:284 stop:532 length:249 start_codon:yes stop_codon:yes gene_type:complete
MKVLNDFICPNGHEQERFVEHGLTVLECLDCGSISTKIRSVPKFILESASGSFPGATMKWAKDREKRLKKEERTVANHGDGE